MTYRSRTDITAQILEAANGGGVTQTQIIYKALVSYDQLKDHLMVLTQNNLLSYDLDTRTFKTTEKGLRFLHTYNQMDGMIKAPPSSLPQEQKEQV
jgi:predicted transcriptional regulator